MKPIFFLLIGMFFFEYQNCHSQIKEGSYVTLIADGKIRTYNEPHSDVKKIVPKGRKVQILGQIMSGYYRVKYRNYTGYMNDVYFGSLSKDLYDTNNKDQGEFTVNLPPILTITNIYFSEKVLDGGEIAKLKIGIKNLGPGDARDVHLNLTGNLSGLDFSEKSIFPTIKANGGIETITVNIKGGYELPSSEAIITIEVVEPNFKVKIQGKQLKFPTREFRKPNLILAKYAVLENQSANPNNQIDINEMIDLNFAVQNIGQGNADNVSIEVDNNQDGVMLLGVKKGDKLVREQTSFPEIKSGKYETIVYQYFVNSEFTDSQLEFTIKSNEKLGKYGFSETKTVSINKQLKESGFIRAVNNEDDNIQGPVIIEDIPNFISDVDQNIPNNNLVSDNSFALIIGNEHYNTEKPVSFAINDAAIFRKYAKDVFGVPEKQIHYIQDATYGQMLNEIRWVKNVIKAYNGKARIYFYYAGHGIPDESSKSAYLLPIDGSPTNTRSSIGLSDLYQSFEEYPSDGVYAFLDACFSGDSRNGKLLTGRGVNIKPKKEFLNKNTVVFSAASGDETAHPYTEQSHGLFTYFLLKKIQESGGNVSLKELADYIVTNVSKLSVVNNRPQHPNINVGMQIKDSWEGINLQK